MTSSKSCSCVWLYASRIDCIWQDHFPYFPKPSASTLQNFDKRSMVFDAHKTHNKTRNSALFDVFLFISSFSLGCFFSLFLYDSIVLPILTPRWLGIHGTHLIDVNLFTRHRQSFPCARLVEWVMLPHGDRWNIPPKKNRVVEQPRLHPWALFWHINLLSWKAILEARNTWQTCREGAWGFTIVDGQHLGNSNLSRH